MGPQYNGCCKEFNQPGPRRAPTLISVAAQQERDINLRPQAQIRDGSMAAQAIRVPLFCTCGMLKCSLAPPSTYSWPCMRSGDGAMMRPLELSEL